MTVRELIAALQGADPDIEVVLSAAVIGTIRPILPLGVHDVWIDDRPDDVTAFVLDIE